MNGSPALPESAFRLRGHARPFFQPRSTGEDTPSQITTPAGSATDTVSGCVAISDLRIL